MLIGFPKCTYFFRKYFPILVNLFHRHGSHDSSLVTFEGHQRYVLDLLFAFAQELLARREQHLGILTLDFDLKHVTKVIIAILQSESNQGKTLKVWRVSECIVIKLIAGHLYRW